MANFYSNPNQIKQSTTPTMYRVTSNEDGSSSSSESDDEEEKDYYKQYVKDEEKLYMQSAANYVPKCVSEMEDVYGSEQIPGCSQTLSQQTNEDLLNAFQTYDLTTDLKADLIIFNYKTEILELIEVNQVVLIEGPTGCGKSTQVPQYILESCQEKNEYCKIVVTQPRRIAASSIAKRVCEERNWALGTVCGYQVGLDIKKSEDTLLTYVTTGVLLQKLISKKDLLEFSHIIIDEIHERSQEMDFLLILIRKFLFTNSPNVKVIIMSATFNTEEFSKYFSRKFENDIIKPPVIVINKKSPYAVYTYYTDHLHEIALIPKFDIEVPKIDKSLYDTCLFIIKAFNRLDKVSGKLGNVLVFLPGINEIEELYNVLSAENQKKDATKEITWKIMPLHSSITTHEQRRVFDVPPPNTRKIILSTNLAESSITVDVDYVIDFCLNKRLIVDAITKYESLQLQWATHVNCEQRAGRVGRISNGRVYRLVPKNFYEKEMRQSCIPEILCCPLDSVVLASKLLNLDEPPKAILALAPNPPNLKNIETTILSLKESGAMLRTCKGEMLSSDGDLTYLGEIMASLPMNVNLSKFIILGYMFGCFNECVIIAAACSLHNIFSTPFQERLKAYKTKLIWADGSCSDLIALLNLYKVWEVQKRSPRFKYNAWALQNCLNARALREWEILVTEITRRLQFFGIKENSGSCIFHSQQELPLILKVIMCGAFYPNYFVRSSEIGQIDEREAVKILNGRDPFNTVYLSGMDSTQPGPLYTQSIKKALKEVSNNMEVNFDGSSKIFLTFSNINKPMSINIDGRFLVAAMPGKVHPEIYQAIRFRQLKIPININLMHLQDALNRVKHMGIDYRFKNEPKDESNSNVNNTLIPSFDVEYIKFRVTEVINAGHFWISLFDTSVSNDFEEIRTLLNSTILKTIEGKILCGNIYVARYVDGFYYRCKVLSILREQAQILYIDYGNIGVVLLKDLRAVPENIMNVPPQAIECVLSEVQPSLVLNSKGEWSQQANELFAKKTRDIILYGKIYSVVNDVIHLEIYRTDPTESNCISLNQLLVKNGLAQPTEENFLSKENHAKRLEMNNYQYEFGYKKTIRNNAPQNIQPPENHECKNIIELKGPFSPLEMKVYPLKVNGHNTNVIIEKSSVNAVLLDSEPQNPHERLLVAVQLGQCPNVANLQARHTTLMPAIPGFPPLMCLLFCPKMEPKLTHDGTRLAGILTGLGAVNENSNHSLYSAHDLYITLDVEITYEDLDLINEIRFWMNTTLDELKSSNLGLQPNLSIDDCRLQIKEKLSKLLKMKRKSVKRVFVPNSSMWNNVPNGIEIFQPASNTPKNNKIWEMHWTVKLNTEISSEVSNVLEYLEQLIRMCRKEDPFKMTSCILCKTTLCDVNDLRIHLLDEDHKRLVQEFKEKHL